MRTKNYKNSRLKENTTGDESIKLFYAEDN
jgi:hypothetical protein